MKVYPYHVADTVAVRRNRPPPLKTAIVHPAGVVGFAIGLHAKASRPFHTRAPRPHPLRGTTVGVEDGAKNEQRLFFIISTRRTTEFMSRARARQKWAASAFGLRTWTASAQEMDFECFRARF